MGLALDELEGSGDQIFDSKGLKILVDKRVIGYLDTIPALTVNFLETQYGSGFVIEGTGSC
ncbi:MAG: hypothetical protein A2176_15335 [Spirochaetes bacterium RBG_13_51_14]|nr:MAG: hypothetical protein A2176_15335 [Spirochaetes bacterium RBG_13_51_14]